MKTALVGLPKCSMTSSVHNVNKSIVGPVYISRTSCACSPATKYATLLLPPPPPIPPIQ